MGAPKGVPIFYEGSNAKPESRITRIYCRGFARYVQSKFELHHERRAYHLKAELPDTEEQRLATLRSLDILDTPLADRYERLTRTAARLFKMPVALITLVDEERQWFKSVCGLDISETSRDVAFCAHSILQDELLVVPDATKDQRFADNLLVTGEPRFRFYAGAPLRAPNGMLLGTFCVLDFMPRDDFSPDDKEALIDLAAATVDQFIIEKSLGTNIGIVADQENNDVLLDMADVYTTFVQQSPVPAIMLDNQMRILAESDRWRQLWKSHPTNNHHSLLLRAAYPQVPERWHRELERCAQSQVQSAGFEQLEMGSGDEKYLVWEVSHWQLADGANGVFLYVRDQSEQRNAEVAAKLSELRFQSVFQKTPTMMHSIDATGHLLEVSDCWLEKLGYCREDVLGRPSTDFLTPESTAYAREIVLPEFFKTGVCKDIPYQFVCANGDILDVLLTANAERDIDGNIIRSVAVLADVQDFEAHIKWFHENQAKRSGEA